MHAMWILINVVCVSVYIAELILIGAEISRYVVRVENVESRCKATVYDIIMKEDYIYRKFGAISKTNCFQRGRD